MTKRKVLVVSVIAVVCVVLLTTALLLSASPEGIGNRLLSKSGENDGQKAVYAAGLTNTAAFQEEGIFYISETRLCFYDCEQEKEYVLCSDPGCDHASENCSAYIGEKRLYGGYAMHQGRIYVMYAKQESSELQVVSMDPVGNDRKVIARLSIGNGDLNEWTLRRIGDVYYDHGYAYMHMYWDQPLEDDSLYGEQLLAIRLSDGQVTELTSILTHEKDYINISFELISEKDVVYSVWFYDPKISSYEEYVIDHPEVSYDEYYATVCETAPQKIRYYDFYPQEGRQELFYEEDMKLLEDPFWGIRGYTDSLLFLGVYQNQWLMTWRPRENFNEGRVYLLWNPRTQEHQVLQKEETGGDGAWGGGYGEVPDCMYSENEILWMEDADKDDKRRKKILLYHLDTGQMETLYTLDTDDPNFPDIRGISGNYVVIGKREWGMGTTYILSKADFEKGNWDEAKKIPVIR